MKKENLLIILTLCFLNLKAQTNLIKDGDMTGTGANLSTPSSMGTISPGSGWAVYWGSADPQKCLSIQSVTDGGNGQGAVVKITAATYGTLGTGMNSDVSNNARLEERLNSILAVNLGTYNVKFRAKATNATATQMTVSLRSSGSNTPAYVLDGYTGTGTPAHIIVTLTQSWADYSVNFDLTKTVTSFAANSATTPVSTYQQPIVCFGMNNSSLGSPAQEYMIDDVTIIKGKGTVIVATGSTSYIYNGSTQGPTTSTVTGSAGTITYSYSGTGATIYSASATSPTNVGTYQVIASVAADATYLAATSIPFSFTINKATPTLSLASSSVNYNGSAQAATINGSVAGITSNVKYNDSSTTPTAVGAYTVAADFVPTDATNYASLTGASAGTFSITATVPDAPTIGTATAGDSQVSVAFTASANNGGSSIIDYTVTSNQGSHTATGASSPIVVSGLTNGIPYTFSVTARNSVGSSSSSSASTTATPASAGITVSSNADISTLSTTSTTDITVSAGYELTVNADASAKSITVAPGGKLTLGTGATLTVVGNALTLQSDGNGTATFVDNNTSSPKTVTGTVQQYLGSARNWYMTSPIAGAIVPTGQTYYSYDETGSNTDFTGSATAYWVAVPEGSALNPMKGYIAQPGATTTLSYTGTFNTGNQNVSLTRTSGKTKEGFNLVANPFPSYLNWAMVDTTIATGAKIMSSVWYRTKTSGGSYTFDTYNGGLDVATSNGATKVTNLIPPMQAFWVRVNEGQTAGTLTFTNAMRAHVDNTLNKFKAPAQKIISQQLLRLQVSNGVNADETIVCFNPNASNGFNGYDSQKMSNNSASIPEIFTMAGTEQLVINGMNSVVLNQEIPLGFTTGQSNAFSIKAIEVSNFDAGTQVIINDNQTNTQWNLSDGSAYNFSSDITTSNTSRFSVIFKAPSITTGNISNNGETNSILVYRNSNNLITVNCVNGIVGQATVSVYNAIGQKLEEKNLTSSITVLDKSFTAGVYIVSVTSNGKTITQKVAIN